MTFDNSNQISAQLLLAVKTERPPDSFVKALEKTTLMQLEKDLENDAQKKAFWINIYNAFFQILRKVKQLDKPRIYREKHINIAGQLFSLDDVEHGILRKYRYKFSLGYLPNIFAPRLIKKLAVKEIDYRIHFALNCGAKSCPPIAFYTANGVEAQLEMATLSFLDGETTVVEDKKEIHISRLFQWFNGDFGGSRGIRKILKEKLNLETKGYQLVYTTYSWEEELDNYAASDFS